MCHQIIKGVLRPLRREAILRRLKFGIKCHWRRRPASFPLFCPAQGADLWDGKTSDGRSLLTRLRDHLDCRHLPGSGKVSQLKALIARNNPRSRKMAAWHMSEVNPSMPGPFEGGML
ncbi:hypothetical protein EVAR_102458_1 [Eumeta japonica]|uniref:Uncharacterized protein n=1 Tax=Eumeta variegata TaxID=151549 RepID=A0A4C1ZQM9_EUMVA|nr:hypothetical protein EVAR_102458_1 [Eumeta japonica]